MPKNQPKEKWEEEFDRLTDSDNFPKGKYHKLLGEHLFDSNWYPESPYELDKEKVKEFIRNLLAKYITPEQHEKMVDYHIKLREKAVQEACKEERERIKAEFLSKAKMSTGSLRGGKDEWRITKEDFNKIIKYGEHRHCFDLHSDIDGSVIQKYTANYCCICGENALTADKDNEDMTNQPEECKHTIELNIKKMVELSEEMMASLEATEKISIIFYFFIFLIGVVVGFGVAIFIPL